MDNSLAPMRRRRGEWLICLPTYNEAENLEPVVAGILESAPWAEALIIDDGSPDGTGEIADRLARADDRVLVRHRSGKLGLGTAYAEGFAWAVEQGYEFVSSMDCDSSHDPRTLPDFADAIQDCDMVVGSRYVPGGAVVNWGLHRRLLSAWGNAVARVVMGIRHRDCTSGFRLLRRRVVQGLDWSGIRSEGYAFLIETLFRTYRAGFAVKEIPIVFVDRQFGESKIYKRYIFEALALVIRFRLGR